MSSHNSSYLKPEILKSRLTAGKLQISSSSWSAVHKTNNIIGKHLGESLEYLEYLSCTPTLDLEDTGILHIKKLMELLETHDSEPLFINTKKNNTSKKFNTIIRIFEFFTLFLKNIVEYFCLRKVLTCILAGADEVRQLIGLENQILFVDRLQLLPIEYRLLYKYSKQIVRKNPWDQGKLIDYCGVKVSEPPQRGPSVVNFYS